MHRAGAAYGFGWVMVLVAGLVLVYGLLGHGYSVRGRVVSAGVAVALACGAYLFGLRPVVEEEPARLVVRNLLRDVMVPWADVVDVRVADVLVVETATASVRCYAVPRRMARGTITSTAVGFGSFLVDRRSPSGQQRDPAKPGTNAVSERIRELALRLGPQTQAGDVTSALSRPALLGVIGLVVGALTVVLAW